MKSANGEIEEEVKKLSEAASVRQRERERERAQTDARPARSIWSASNEAPASSERPRSHTGLLPVDDGSSLPPLQHTGDFERLGF